MARQTTIAAVAGLVLGSITTVFATALLSGASSKKKKIVKEEEPETEPQSRGLDIVAMIPPEINQAENVNFLSDILNRLWPYIAAAGADMVRETVEPMFKEMMPGPLASLRFTKIDLGKAPILLDNVIVHELKNGNVQFDLDVTWDSDSDIQLKADFIGSFGVKSIKLSGRMTFLLKPLTNVLPIVSAIQYAFINPPELELDFTGLANIADFSIIDKTIRSIMQEVLASMVVLPYRMMYKMDLGSDFREFYQHPVGVARITCVRGRGFIVEKKMLGKGDVPDVYCNIKLGCEQVWKTSTVKDNLSPEWNESKDFLLSDNDQIISLEAWDEDKGPLDSDDYLGTARVTVGEFLLAGKTMEVELQQDQQGTGAFVTLHCDMCRFTTTDLSGLERPKNANQLGGLLTVIVTRALDLPLNKKDAASFVKVTHGSQEFVTGVVVDAPGYDATNPVYDIAFRVPLTAGTAKSAVKLQLMNGDKVLGETVVEHADLVAAPNMTVMECRKVVGDASIEFCVSLVAVPGPGQEPPVILAASSSIDTPVATKDTVRVSIVSGRGFQIKKRFMKKTDVPDVYCQIKFGSSPKVWRTATIKNSVSPDWKDESSDYTISSNNQVIALDVYDENRKGEDDFLGSARIIVGKCLLGGGSIELELQQSGSGTGTFILLRCDKV